MKFVAIGRGDILLATILRLQRENHDLIGVVTDEGAKESRNQIKDFAKIASLNKVPLIESSSNKNILKFLKEFDNLEIGISVNHRNIISSSVLDLFRHGVLNLHGGDLPRFKGNACQAWAIINGESRIGACVYRMEPDLLDTGKILSRRYLDLKVETKIQDCLSWLEFNGPDMFAESLKKLQSDPKFFIEDSGSVSIPSLRCHERRPEDGYIDWNKEPDEIVRLVNASGPPYFGAFSFLDGQLLKVLSAEVVDNTEQYLAIPGQIIQVQGDYVLLACGVGKSLRISEVDFGGGCVKASTILKSTRMRLGSKQHHT